MCVCKTRLYQGTIKVLNAVLHLLFSLAFIVYSQIVPTFVALTPISWTFSSLFKYRMYFNAPSFLLPPRYYNANCFKIDLH